LSLLSASVLSLLLLCVFLDERLTVSISDRRYLVYFLLY
jgi:hypothetical protein